ncbi:MAG: hypothetical protein H0T42_05700 [Deltaproteobacteria bacterium]|nr:hypothetical protein [Deltaproteobacteria bacterium]
MTRAALVLACLAPIAFGAGCKKKAVDPGPPADLDTAPPLPGPELKRGQDACQAYVAAVCACTAPAAAEACSLAKALPDALQVATEISVSPDSRKRDVLQANDSARKTIASCIEHTAKLPALGC